MKFSEYVNLLWPELKLKLFDLGLVKTEDKRKKLFDLFNGKIDESLIALSMHKKELNSLLETYLLTGGIPLTINEFKKDERISTNTFNIYLNAIIGDLRRYNYKEHYFKQICREIFNSMPNPVSWNNFTKHTDVRSHNTAQDYITALEELYVVNIAYRCSVHDRRIHPFLKKIYVLDPFMFHALHGWSNAKRDYFSNSKTNILDLQTKSNLIEGVVYNHLCRFSYSLYPRDLFDPKDTICYFKDAKNKEIDFVLMTDDDMYPFEVKYQASIANSDFSAFKSFNKGVMITKDTMGIHNEKYAMLPVSLFLMLI
jgi:hypothetical protein